MMASVLTVPSLIPINAGYYHARANYRAARALDAATWASTRDAGSTESSAFHLAENLFHTSISDQAFVWNVEQHAARLAMNRVNIVALKPARWTRMPYLLRPHERLQ
jgi:hypothetical protein